MVGHYIYLVYISEDVSIATPPGRDGVFEESGEYLPRASHPFAASFNLVVLETVSAQRRAAAERWSSRDQQWVVGNSVKAVG